MENRGLAIAVLNLERYHMPAWQHTVDAITIQKVKKSFVIEISHYDSAA